MARISLATTILLSLLLCRFAVAQGTWELKVCADPNDYPASSQERPGFENRISEILADELGASLSYTWTRIDRNAVRHELQKGTCDVIMGVSEGAAGVINTVSYYRAPYVFVYPDDADFDVDSLEDESLAALTLTTFPNSLLHEALAAYDLDENMLSLPPERFNQPGRPSLALILAILEGEADIALAYGPDVADLVAKHDQRLTMKPVAPQIVPPLLQMFRIVTIGVRSGDEALRDRLNIALANRWEEIQAVFEQYDVPVLQVPQPRVSDIHQHDVARVGVVLPLPTGNAELTDAAALAAQTGALIAEDLSASARGPDATAVDVLMANAPTLEAAERAARRMVNAEDVTAIIGGIGEGQAQLLSGIAARGDALFFNIGESAASLRGEACRPTSFHVAASAAMYLDGMFRLFAQDGRSQLFIVYSDDSQGEDLFDEAESVAEGSDVTVIGSAIVRPRSFMYGDAIDAIAKASPDAVAVLLSPADQELFLSQYRQAGFEAPAAGYPFAVTQTRLFLARLRQVAADTGPSYRLATWDTTLQDDGAGELNERFVSRSAQPMDPTGWNAYAAITVLHQTLNESTDTDIASLVTYLEHPDTMFDLHKGRSLSFRPGSHQLSQPLYRIEVDPEAPWSRSASGRVALAGVIGQMPSPDESLEPLGDPSPTWECTSP